MRMFGQNMRAARLRTSRAQDKLGLDKKMVCYLELGERSPRLVTILSVARALGVTPRELLAGIGARSEIGMQAGPAHPSALAPPRPDLGWPAARFGANLRWVRRREGVSQMELAGEAGVDRAGVGAIERGERGPKLHTILKLAWTLEVPAALLLHGVGDPES